MIKNISKKEFIKELKKQKQTKKQLGKECMSLWTECVKLRAKNQCEYCGKKENLNAHHFFSRSRISVRYNINNGLCLCAGCHSLTNFSAHKDPLFKDKILEKGIRTKQWLIILERQANTPAKIDLKLELLYLQNYKKELLKNN